MNHPLILAHRGASAYAPENTIAAFMLARELGAEGIELDVQLSRDHVPVVIHDDTVDRTTDGQGKVSALTIAELKQLDAGNWKSFRYEGERIPTLAEVFSALEAWLHPVGRAPSCVLNIELKTEHTFKGMLEREVVNLITRRNLQERVLLSSFDAFALQRVRRLHPEIGRGFLYDRAQFRSLPRPWLRWLAAPDALHPDHTLVNANLMRWARSHSVTVNTWTVDERAEALRLADLGVTSIITNRPDLLRHVLG